MRVLLDECLPRRLRTHRGEHAVATVPDAGWAGTKNGALLRLAAAHYDVFITIDRNLVAQQTAASLPIAVVTLAAPTNRLEDLLPLVPAILRALTSISAGQVVSLGS